MNTDDSIKKRLCIPSMYHFVHFSILNYKSQQTEHLVYLPFSRQVVSNSSWPHGLQHAKLPCFSPSLRVCTNSCPLNQWYHLTISSSATFFSSCLQSFPGSGFFTMSRLFASGDQGVGASASASVLPVNIQGWPTWFWYESWWDDLKTTVSSHSSGEAWRTHCSQP